MVAESMASWVAARVREHEPVVSLRDYQDEAVTHVAHAVEKDGKRRVIVVLPTGAGKTVVFGALAHAWLSDDLGRVLVLAHRDELIQQAVAKLSVWLPRHLIGIVKAQQDEHTSPVVVASVQTLKNEKRLARVGRFGMIVVDECHHASAASYRTILAELGAFRQDGPIVVGVTATPKRGDGVRLDDVFEGIVYARTYTDMVAAGYLVPVESQVFDLIEQQSFGKAKLGIDGDYSEGWLEGVMLRANAPDKIVEAWQKEASDRRTIVFTPTVSVAKAVAASFTAAGVAAAWISGAMPTADRRAVLAGLAQGRIQVVANCAVLTEGFDEPSVSCIVVGRPTMNESLYIQMVGRGTRLHPESGKKDCLVLDMVGCADQLQLDAVLELGGRGVSRRGESVPSAAGGEDVPFQVVAGSLTGRKVKAVKSICRWVPLPDGWFALSMLGDWLTVEPDDEGTFRVVRRPKRGKPSVLHPGLDQEWAKVVGEGVARNEGTFGAMTRRAGWLDRPVSEKALAFGQRMGFPITAETTAWEFTKMQAERAYAGWRR